MNDHDLDDARESDTLPPDPPDLPTAEEKLDWLVSSVYNLMNERLADTKRNQEFRTEISARIQSFEAGVLTSERETGKELAEQKVVLMALIDRIDKIIEIRERERFFLPLPSSNGNGA